MTENEKPPVTSQGHSTNIKQIEGTVTSALQESKTAPMRGLAGVWMDADCALTVTEAIADL